MTPPGDTSSRMDQGTQPAGIPTIPQGTGPEANTGPDGHVLGLHARLCELVEDPKERAALLKVPTTVDAAWQAGQMLPVLRAQRRVLETIVANLERKG